MGRGKRMFRPRREEVTGEMRNLHNEDLHNLYSSSEIVMVIKSREMKWAGHVTCIVQLRNAFKIYSGNLKETTWKTKEQMGGKVKIN
jgi:hypothetical protein